MPDTTDLEARAAGLPSMGGVEIGPRLRAAARGAAPGTAIVEVGCWLGAGTAQLALGLREAERLREVDIHCFDRFRATGSEVEKAGRFNVTLMKDADTRPVVEGFLAPFGASIRLHRGSILDARWSGPPISVYVDDASKTDRLWEHSVATFSPHWIVGSTVLVLMDFFYYRRSGREDHRCQQRFVDRHSGCFEEIARSDKTSALILRYIAALPLQRLPLRSRIRQLVGL